MPLIELELFKTGDYPQGEFTDADIQEVVDSYDPKNIHRAPLVIGHKTNEERAKTGEPAYGYFDALKRIGSKLFGHCDAVDKAKEIMTTTHRRWSVEFYKKGALKEANGKLYLKAVALLGAAAPQVKGLAPVQFNDAFGESISIEQEGEMPEGITKSDLESGLKTGFDRFLDSFKSIFGKNGGEKGTKKFSDNDDDVKSIGEQLDGMSKPEITEVLDEIANSPRVQEVAAELEEDQADLEMAELEKDPNYKFRMDTQKKSIADWVDKMIKENHLVPAAKDAGIVNFLELLASADDGDGKSAVKFAEKGDEITPLQFFQNIVEKHLKVPDGEIVKPDEKGGEKKPNMLGIKMAEHDANGRKIEMHDVDFAEKARALSVEKKIPLDEAMVIVAQTQQ